MSSPEVEAALHAIRLAILPVGSCEQHGPNMTFETDTAIAQGLAEQLGQRLYPEALVVPVVPCGVSPHHMSFAGTITLRPETLEAVLWDVVASLKSHGLRHFLIVNGHGGNRATLENLSRRLRREMGVLAATMFYMSLAADVAKAGATTTRYGHACEVEASVGLYLAPRTVMADRVAGQLKPAVHSHTEEYGVGGIDFPFRIEELTANGALGDARHASFEFGRAIAEAALDRTIEFLRTFLGVEV
jgi:creatinine amidohydrolase